MPIPTPKFHGVQPPPSSQDISQQSFAKDTSKSSLCTAFSWTRNTCALRAPGTDPTKLRKDLITADGSRNAIGLNTGKESGVNNPAAFSSRKHSTDQISSDGNAPFGVPRRLHAKEKADPTNWAWVEQVLKIKSKEVTAPRGAPEVRI